QQRDRAGQQRKPGHDAVPAGALDVAAAAMLRRVEALRVGGEAGAYAAQTPREISGLARHADKEVVAADVADEDVVAAELGAQEVREHEDRPVADVEAVDVVE